MFTYITTTAPGCSAFHCLSWSAVIEADSEQPASRSGIRTFLSGREDRRRLGHEVDAAEDDHLCLGGGRLARQTERVADEVRDVLDLGHLVVVGEDHCLALRDQRADLVLHPAHVLDRQDVAAASRWVGWLEVASYVASCCLEASSVIERSSAGAE